MKFILALALGILSTTTFAAVKCVGTTVTFYDDGTAESTEVLLDKIAGEKNHAVYYAESDVFKFRAHQKDKAIALEIVDKQRDVIVVENPRMTVARFNVSIGGYWKNYFASLNCTPVQN